MSPTIGVFLLTLVFIATAFEAMAAIKWKNSDKTFIKEEHLDLSFSIFDYWLEMKGLNLRVNCKGTKKPSCFDQNNRPLWRDEANKLDVVYTKGGVYLLITTRVTTP